MAGIGDAVPVNYGWRCRGEAKALLHLNPARKSVRCAIQQLLYSADSLGWVLGSVLTVVRYFIQVLLLVALEQSQVAAAVR